MCSSSYTSFRLNSPDKLLALLSQPIPNPILYYSLGCGPMFSLSPTMIVLPTIFVVVSIDFTPQQVYCLLCHGYPTGTPTIAPVYTEPVYKLYTGAVYTGLTLAWLSLSFIVQKRERSLQECYVWIEWWGGQTRFWYSTPGLQPLFAWWHYPPHHFSGGGHWGVPFYHELIISRCASIYLVIQ